MIISFRIVQCTPVICSEHVLVALTSTPDPSKPPKYQTSSVMWSFSTDVPPGKKSRMLQSTHTLLSGIKVIPRHLAKLPEHILTLMVQPTNWKTTSWIAQKPPPPFFCTEILFSFTLPQADEGSRGADVKQQSVNLHYNLSIKYSLTAPF